MRAIKIPCEHDLLSKNDDTWANAVMRCKGGSPYCGADGYCSDNFSDSGSCELTLPQLRDLVAKSKPTEQGLIGGADALRALADGEFVGFEVASDVETDDSLVLFDLVYGSIEVKCSMTANVVTKLRKVAYIPSRYGDNYQYEEEYEQEYEQLVVDEETFVLVVNNDNTGIPNGSHITLTKSQVAELNEHLEYLAEEEIQ